MCSCTVPKASALVSKVGALYQKLVHCIKSWCTVSKVGALYQKLVLCIKSWCTVSKVWGYLIQLQISDEVHNEKCLSKHERVRSIYYWYSTNTIDSGVYVFGTVYVLLSFVSLFFDSEHHILGTVYRKFGTVKSFLVQNIPNLGLYRIYLRVQQLERELLLCTNSYDLARCTT